MTFQTVLLLAIVAAEPAAPFNPVRKIEVGGRTRSYVFIYPPNMISSSRLPLSSCFMAHPPMLISSRVSPA